MQKIILISWKHPLITVDCKMAGIMVVLFNFISNITKLARDICFNLSRFSFTPRTFIKGSGFYFTEFN